VNQGLRTQIYKELDLRETDDLLDIWTTNDHVEWSDIAFDVLREILQKRIGEIPSQNAPIYEHREPPADDTDLESWEEKLLDSEQQPVFYDSFEVLSLRDNINRVATAAIVVYVFAGLFNNNFVRGLLQGVVLPLDEVVSSIPSILITIISVALQIAFTYFSLKALSYILRILMEMEFNSRRPASPAETMAVD
jgi:hypothetical protein